MSHLVGIDDLLDLVSDVKEIDRMTYRLAAGGLITVQLWCEDVQHSEVMMSERDFQQAQMILTGALAIERATPEV
jgi:hypothetical protein